MRIHIVVLATAIGLSAGELLAQRPHARDGVNVSFGFGGGSAHLGCSLCGRSRQGGTAYYLNVGGTISPRFTLGGELNGFGYATNDEYITIGSVLAVAHLYPEPASGFFFTVGAGVAGASVEDRLQSVEVYSSGFGIEGGLGYDVRLGRNFSLTPYAQFVKGFSGQVSYSGTSRPDQLNPDYYQIGLGFTWH
jgi:hypothetical protein